MTQSKTILISTLATSLLVLAGCTTQTTTNTNVVTNANTTNTNVVVDTNENTNVTVANENTNTEQASEVDTSDWLTYTNEEYGFSFKYPENWQLSTNDSGITVLEYTLPNSISVTAKNFVLEDVVMQETSNKVALKFEDGREPLPLISEEFSTINTLDSYKAVRQLKKGESILSGTEINTLTRTEVEYTYLYNNDLFRIWFTIDGDNPELMYADIDNIAKSFSL